MLNAKFKNIVTAIDDLFSTKHDLLAIGLFTGASIALMLSELFNWLLNNYIAKAMSTDGFWFAVISFFILFLKLLGIAFVLFYIDWLYNKFVRRHFVDSVSNIKQETTMSVAIENTKVLNDVGQGRPSASGLDLESEQIPSNMNVQSSFISEYLREHGDKSDKAVTADKIQEPFALKYQKKDQLRIELAELLEDESELDSDINADIDSGMEQFDLVATLSEDFKNAASRTKFIESQKEDLAETSAAQITELSPEKIRSVLAKN